MMRTLSHTDDQTIKSAPDALQQVRGYLLAHEHEARDGDTSWYSWARGALSYAIDLADEARDHFLERDRG